MKRYFFVLYMLCIVLTISCSESLEQIRLPNNNSVSIHTLSHDFFEDGGVRIKGRIDDVELMIDYGVIVNSDSVHDYLPYNTFTKIISSANSGAFIVDVKSNLLKGKTYYYKSFAHKNGKLIFGEEKTFKSNGSAFPVVTSIDPVLAHQLDTVVIIGSNFSDRASIYFNKDRSTILFNNDTLIKCIFRINNQYSLGETPEVTIKIKNNDNQEILYDEFSLHTPKIDSIVPYDVFPGDTVVMYGDHFYNRYGNRLKIETIAVYPTPIRQTRKKITFRINSVGTYKPNITLFSQNQIIEVENKFRAKLPVISGVSANKVSFGDKLVIYGNYFQKRDYYSYDNLKYKFGSEQMSHYNVYKDSIVLEINKTAPYKDFIVKNMSITFFDNEIKLEENITIDSEYIAVSNSSRSITCLGAIGENIYAVHHYYFGQDVLMKYDKETQDFKPIYINSSSDRINLSLYSVFNGTKFYTPGVDLDNTIHLISYDVLSYEKKILALVPFSGRHGTLMKSVGDYIYSGVGTKNYPTRYYDDIWRYSVNTDEWEFVTNLTNTGDSDGNYSSYLQFTIGSKIYYATGESPSLFWEIDSNSNTITRKNNLPTFISNTSATGVVIDNKYYIDNMDGSNACIYDPSTDLWTTKTESLKIDPTNHYIFSTKDFIYSYGFENSVLYKIKKNAITE